MAAAAKAPPRPQAILTELNGVLFQDVYARAAQLLADETGVNARTLRGSLEEHRRAFDRGGEDTERFFRAVSLDAELTLGLERFEAILLGDAIVPAPENLERLRALHDGGVRLVAVSNIAGPILDAVETRLPVLEPFDAAILSFREQIAKPNPQVYIEAMELSERPTASLLYIDSSEEHLAGAGEWGMQRFLVRAPEELGPGLDRYFPA